MLIPKPTSNRVLFMGQPGPKPAQPALMMKTLDTVSFSGTKLHRPFPKSGSGNIRIYQGAWSDCQTLSSLHALSRNPAGEALLNNLITVQPDGNYRVVFPAHPHMPIKISPAELKQRPVIDGKTRRPVGGTLGVRILERAFAKLNKGLYPQKYNNIPYRDILKVFESPHYHYNPAQSLQDITGWETRQLLAGNTFEQSDLSFSEAFRQTPAFKKQVLALLKTLANNPKEYVMVAGTRSQSPNAKQKGLGIANILNPFHDYAVEKINPKNKTVTLRNPHNNQVAYTYTYQDFFRYFYALTYAKVPAPHEAGAWPNRHVIQSNLENALLRAQAPAVTIAALPPDPQRYPQGLFKIRLQDNTAQNQRQLLQAMDRIAPAHSLWNTLRTFQNAQLKIDLSL